MKGVAEASDMPVAFGCEAGETTTELCAGDEVPAVPSEVIESEPCKIESAENGSDEGDENGGRFAGPHRVTVG